MLDAYPHAKMTPEFQCKKCKKMVTWTINDLCEDCFKMPDFSRLTKEGEC